MWRRAREKEKQEKQRSMGTGEQTSRRTEEQVVEAGETREAREQAHLFGKRKQGDTGEEEHWRAEGNDAGGETERRREEEDAGRTRATPLRAGAKRRWGEREVRRGLRTFASRLDRSRASRSRVFAALAFFPFAALAAAADPAPLFPSFRDRFLLLQASWRREGWGWRNHGWKWSSGNSSRSSAAASVLRCGWSNSNKDIL